MFKRHVYTCPDVIYIRNRNRKIGIITNGATLGLFAALWVYAWYEERKLDNMQSTTIEEN